MAAILRLRRPGAAPLPRRPQDPAAAATRHRHLNAPGGPEPAGPARYPGPGRARPRGAASGSLHPSEDLPAPAPDLEPLQPLQRTSGPGSPGPGPGPRPGARLSLPEPVP